MKKFTIESSTDTLTLNQLVLAIESQINPEFIEIDSNTSVVVKVESWNKPFTAMFAVQELAKTLDANFTITGFYHESNKVEFVAAISHNTMNYKFF